MTRVPTMARVPVGESRYYLVSFWTQKGKVRLLLRSGVTVCRQWEGTVIFPKGFSYKTELILSKYKYKHLEFDTCGIPRYMDVYRSIVSKDGTQPYLRLYLGRSKVMFKKISQNFVKSPLKFSLISWILVHSSWHVWYGKVTNTEIKWLVISKSVTIIIFVEFIDQLIDYPIIVPIRLFVPPLVLFIIILRLIYIALQWCQFQCYLKGTSILIHNGSYFDVDTKYSVKS